MWIIENGRFGPRCVSSREFWEERYGSALSTDRYWLLCHPDPEVVRDLVLLVERIVSAPRPSGDDAMPDGPAEHSAPGPSGDDAMPDGPADYKVLGYLSGGAHKQVYLGAAKRPGEDDLGGLVALKRYTQAHDFGRDVINPTSL